MLEALLIVTPIVMVAMLDSHRTIAHQEASLSVVIKDKDTHGVPIG